jgi:hypothetical protein
LSIDLLLFLCMCVTFYFLAINWKT